MAAVIPTDPGFAYRRAEVQVSHLEHELADLDRANGWGLWRGTPVGDAAIAYRRATEEHRTCLARAEQAGLMERHQLRRQAQRALERAAPLRAEFEALAAPERDSIQAEIPEAKTTFAELKGAHDAHSRFEILHPEAFRRLDYLDRQIAEAAYGMDLERQSLDGMAPPVPELSRGLGRNLPALERSIDLGIDL